MKYIITAVPEDEADLRHPLAGAWEIRTIPAAPGPRIPPELVLIDGYKADLDP
jgi:hypothetical protein